MTLRASIGRRAPAVVAMAAGAALTVAGSLLPWVRTGDARRNSYDVFALAERLGFSPDGAAAQGLHWWPVVPLLTAVAVVVAWWGWPRAGGIVGLLAGGYAGGVGLAVGTADAAGVVIEAGATVTAVGGVVLVLGSVAAVLIGWLSPTRPTDLAR